MTNINTEKINSPKKYNFSLNRKIESSSKSEYFLFRKKSAPSSRLFQLNEHNSSPFQITYQEFLNMNINDFLKLTLSNVLSIKIDDIKKKLRKLHNIDDYHLTKNFPNVDFALKKKIHHVTLEVLISSNEKDLKYLFVIGHSLFIREDEIQNFSFMDLKKMVYARNHSFELNSKTLKELSLDELKKLSYIQRNNLDEISNIEDIKNCSLSDLKRLAFIKSQPKLVNALMADAHVKNAAEYYSITTTEQKAKFLIQYTKPYYIEELNLFLYAYIQFQKAYPSENMSLYCPLKKVIYFDSPEEIKTHLENYTLAKQRLNEKIKAQWARIKSNYKQEEAHKP